LCLLEYIFGYFNIIPSYIFFSSYGIYYKNNIKILSPSNQNPKTITFYNNFIHYNIINNSTTTSIKTTNITFKDSVLPVSSTFRNFYNNKDIILYKNSRIIDSLNEFGNTRENLVVYGENLSNSFSKRWFRIIYGTLSRHLTIKDYTNPSNAYKYRKQILRVIRNSTHHFYSLDIGYFFSSIFFNNTQTWCASIALPTFSMIYLKVIRHRRSHSVFIKIIRRFLRSFSNISNYKLLANKNKSISSLSYIYDYDGFIKGRSGNLKRVVTKRFLYRKTYLSVKSHSGDGYFPSMYGATRNTRWGSTSFYIVFYIKI